MVAHPGVDQDNASEMTVYRCHTTTGLHPLHIPHSNLDAHPSKKKKKPHSFIVVLHLSIDNNMILRAIWY